MLTLYDANVTALESMEIYEDGSFVIESLSASSSGDES